jgi:hypothetical protein
MWLFSAGISVAWAVAPADVRGSTGWKDRGTRKTDVGVVQLWSRELPEAYCVRAGLQTEVSVATLLEVAADIPAAPAWSTQDLVLSEVLGTDGPSVSYWQYLDVPTWLVVADRYWVVTGTRASLPDGAARFSWAQLPAEAHPEVDEAARARSDRALRLPVTVGEWSFEPREGGSWASYTNCADPGGRLPDWVVRFAATRTVPDNMADLVREARTRSR